MIKSFRSMDTERLFRRERVKKFQAIERVALRKLRMLDGTWQLRDLAAAPGNRLEALKGDRAGQHSIRINDSTGFVFYGKRATRLRWRSSTIIRERPWPRN